MYKRYDLIPVSFQKFRSFRLYFAEGSQSSDLVYQTRISLDTQTRRPGKSRNNSRLLKS